MVIAIIGYGNMGKYHYERINKLDYLNVKGVFDIEKDRIDLAQKDGLKVYKSYEEIASDKDIKGVLIATPNDSHSFYIKYFAKAGKKILCEKPAVNSETEFTEIIKDTEDCVLLINQNRRYDMDYLTAKKIVEEGKVGKIYRIESRVTGANGVPGGWRKIKEKGGGMMLDWGVHLIDQICCMFSDITALSCTYSYALGFDVEDGFLANFITAKGISIIIEVQTNDFIGTERWKIFGRDGSAVIKNWELEGGIITPVYDEQPEVVSMNAGNGLTKTMAYRSHKTVKNYTLPQIECNCDEIYKNFFQAKNDSELIVKHKEVQRVLNIMDKCKESALNGGSLIKIQE